MSYQFYQTALGRKFYEYDVRRIIKALEKIAKSLEKIANDTTPDNGIDNQGKDPD